MRCQIQWKLFTATLFITPKLFITSIVLAQMCQFSLNLNSFQQKFSLTSNCLGTNSVVVVRVGLLTSLILSGEGGILTRLDITLNKLDFT